MLVPTIGIEVHVELKSKTKVFSDSLNDFNADVNTNVNVIDLGYPGTLPKLNKEVINMALSAALALNCKINKVMHFNRKNYFYPDLPKGYQITQMDTPIGYDGYVEIDLDGETKRIAIERIHIEEDTCKSIHTDNQTLLNANRAGVPLVEIVTKPVITSDKEAVLYLEKLREIMLYLGVSDVKIEEGSMRCDANISLKEVDSDVLGTKTEVKNIGSISNVGASIRYEISRQTEILKSGNKVVGETRRFDDKTNTTILMRTKESNNDYRYFPEPDIPYVILSDEWINEVKSNMPVMAEELKIKYESLGINNNGIKTITSNLELANFFETMNSDCDPVIAANLLTGEVLSYLNKNFVKLLDTKLNKENFTALVKLVENNTISNKQAKDIIPVLIEKGGNTNELVQQLGMKQITDDKEIIAVITKVLNANKDSIDDYKQGKDRAIKYLMGQIMKETKGQANPVAANEKLIELLEEY